MGRHGDQLAKPITWPPASATYAERRAMFSASQARPSPGASAAVVHMAVECSITSLRIARTGSASAGSARRILYSGVMSTMVDSPAAFGERLRGARKARNWAIGRLAAESGVSRAMISKIERGESSPTAVLLGKLSAALELSVSELLAPRDGRPGAGRRAGVIPRWQDPGTGYLRRQV